MAGAIRAASFCSSTSHHGLTTAPDGDFFNSCKNSRSDLADMVPTKLQRGCDAGNPARIARTNRNRGRTAGAASCCDSQTLGVRVKRVYDQPAKADGYRVLV